MKNIDANLIQIAENFKSTYDYDTFEKEISTVINAYLSSFIQDTLQEVLLSEEYLSMIKTEAKQHDLSYQGDRLLSVNIWHGEHILLESPYFYKRNQKTRGPKKQGRKTGNNIDGHYGLSRMGFISRFSPGLVNEICTTSVIAPSEQMAVDLLEQKGIELDIKTLRNTCRDVFNISSSFRGGISFAEHGEQFTDLTLVVGIDGGRIRTRKTKRGRKKKGQKRQSYHTDWKEPKLFSLYFTDTNGNIVKEIEPVYDATLSGKDAVFELLSDYLDALPGYLSIKQVVFTGDGAPWIWSGIETIIEQRFADIQSWQVLDFTHAKQALGEIFELLPSNYADADKLWKNATDMLWKGDIKGLQILIKDNFKGKNKKKALKKWADYFHKNQKRMQYSEFRKHRIPTGSGSVESAIRRVINMRLKSAGSFWLDQWAEVFLFIRAQVVSGRWKYVTQNLKSRLSGQYLKSDVKQIKTTNFMKYAT